MGKRRATRFFSPDDPNLPLVFLDAGTHGDEPAGVESALKFLEGPVADWGGRLRILIVPCLSPYAWAHETRHIVGGVDVSWSFLRDGVAEILCLKQIIEGRRFYAVLDRHEDWESAGYYLFELPHGSTPSQGRFGLSARSTSF